MQWTQYELAADSWQELQTADPTMLPASTRVAPVGPCQLQLDGQALVVQPERGTDLWPAMKQGKRPGQDPDARDRSTETWLAFRLAKLSSAEEKYTLLRAAVCEHPPSITGLSIVLEIALEWGLDLSAYVQTPEGLFSLPALVLHCNKFTNCDPELSAQVVSALCHLVDIGTSLKMPARLALEREPDTTLAHEVVYEHHSTDVSSCAAEVLSWIYEMGQAERHFFVHAALETSRSCSSCYSVELISTSHAMAMECCMQPVRLAMSMWYATCSLKASLLTMRAWAQQHRCTLQASKGTWALYACCTAVVLMFIVLMLTGSLPSLLHIVVDMRLSSLTCVGTRWRSMSAGLG